MDDSEPDVNVNGSRPNHDLARIFSSSLTSVHSRGNKDRIGPNYKPASEGVFSLLMHSSCW